MKARLGAIFAGTMLSLSAAASAEPVDALRIAAAQGDVGAQMRLADAHASSGATHAAEQALAWRLRAAQAGHPEAYMLVAQAYHDGKGTPADVKRSLVWYQKAADAGNATAQNEVAFHIATDVRGDLRIAQALIDKALAQQPENPHYLDTKATILERQGHWYAAEGLLRRAHRLAPQDREIVRHLKRADHHQR